MALDIFSKSKNNPEEKQTIIIDFREKNSLVPSFLVKNNCLIEFKQLEIGDYITGGTIIERKTFSDLQSSILDKRIFTQINNLKDIPNKILIIEEEKENLRLNINAIRGFVLSTIKNKNIPIIFSKDAEETAQYIRLLSNKKQPTLLSLRPNAKFKTREARLHYILEGFPGIGPATSKRLVERFKSIKEIVNAEEKDLKEILGKKYTLFKKTID